MLTAEYSRKPDSAKPESTVDGATQRLGHFPLQRKPVTDTDEKALSHDFARLQVHADPQAPGPVARANSPEASRDVSDITTAIDKSRGQQLASEILASMEPYFGHTLADVRVHTDTQAEEAAAALRAQAFTVGSHIVFGKGQYVPSTSSGRALIAHELTHVVQQRRGSGQLAQRQSDRPTVTPGKGVPATSTTDRLLAVVAKIERLQATVSQTDHAAADKGGASASAEHARRLEIFAQHLRAVANTNDEQLKLSVLSAFSDRGIQRAEAMTQAGGEDTLTHTPVRPAAKSLELSDPKDAAEIEADRVATAVVGGTPARIKQNSQETIVHRQAGAAAASAAAIFAFEGESLPATSWNPPGWVVLGVATVVAAGLLIYAAASHSESQAHMATAVQGDRLAGNTKQLGIHLARLLGAASVGGQPSGEPPKKDDRNDKHWWGEIKAVLKNIRQAIGGASRKQVIRALLNEGFTEEQIAELEAKLAEAARMMGEEPPPFIPPP